MSIITKQLSGEFTTLRHTSSRDEGDVWYNWARCVTHEKLHLLLHSCLQRVYPLVPCCTPDMQHEDIRGPLNQSSGFTSSDCQSRAYVWCGILH
ncbi:uncharacterized protein RCC_05854 [Ramularia collo-cygni]|uniref:Uncharacterized protein n=1 Tax=Ramularia collo-cygni TaxID=112498 RepID=A0A2D3V5L2_9PEZI|nr:uncharacterized protein RCC_05854 [Ramularia collo-cygni]CZT19997.1 uncharacterized protein RCC_05854 [Ramularia collo-cygni]